MAYPGLGSSMNKFQWAVLLLGLLVVTVLEPHVVEVPFQWPAVLTLLSA